MSLQFAETVSTGRSILEEILDTADENNISVREYDLDKISEYLDMIKEEEELYVSDIDGNLIPVLASVFIHDLHDVLQLFIEKDKIYENSERTLYMFNRFYWGMSKEMLQIIVSNNVMNNEEFNGNLIEKLFRERLNNMAMNMLKLRGITCIVPDERQFPSLTSRNRIKQLVELHDIQITKHIFSELSKVVDRESTKCWDLFKLIPMFVNQENYDYIIEIILELGTFDESQGFLMLSNAISRSCSSSTVTITRNNGIRDVSGSIDYLTKIFETFGNVFTEKMYLSGYNQLLVNMHRYVPKKFTRVLKTLIEFDPYNTLFDKNDEFEVPVNHYTNEYEHKTYCENMKTLLPSSNYFNKIFTTDECIRGIITPSFIPFWTLVPVDDELVPVNDDYDMVQHRHYKGTVSSEHRDLVKLILDSKYFTNCNLTLQNGNSLFQQCVILGWFGEARKLLNFDDLEIEIYANGDNILNFLGDEEKDINDKIVQNVSN